MSVAVWTFQVRGGKAFDLLVPGNPPVWHDGVLSVWSLVLTDEGAKAVGAFAVQSGATVTRTSGIDLEPPAPPRPMLGDAVAEFPTARCPSCFWMDPELDSRCALVSGPAESVRAAWEAHERARDDADACPLRTGEP